MDVAEKKDPVIDPTPIYPDVLIVVSQITLSLSTYLRVEHQGKWYKQKFVSYFTSMSAKEPDPKSYMNLLNGFNRGVYLHIVGGKVDLELLDQHGEKVYTLDENQDSELQRFQNLFKQHKG